MLRLTEETGQPVQAADGSTLGALLDLTIRLDVDEYPLVERLVVGHRHHVSHLVSWTAVASFEHSLVQLDDDGGIDAIDADELADLPLHHDELLLVRDVLDTQIVDIADRRLERVGDVLLTRLSDDRLRVVAVDVGFGSVAHRIGMHRLEHRLSQDAVDWRFLHLTSARGHIVQLTTTKTAVHRLDARELAVLVSRLSTEAGADVLETVHPTRAAEALTASQREVRRRLMMAMDEEPAAAVVEELPSPHKKRYARLRAEPPAPRRRYLRHRGWRKNLPANGSAGAPRTDEPPPSEDTAS